MSKGQTKGRYIMGMASSQARLLTLTARMHDVEYQAQSIQNAKISLATQEDAVHKKYLEALDATTLTVKDWQGNLITANFNTLCGISAADVGNYRYALFDSKGSLIVDDEIVDGYSAYKSSGAKMTAEAFAFYMLTGSVPDTDCDFTYAVDEYRADYKGGVDKKSIDEAYAEICAIAQQIYPEVDIEDLEGDMDEFLNGDKEDIQSHDNWDFSDDTYEALEKARTNYFNLIDEANYQMFRSDAEKIFASIDDGEYASDFNQNDFDYYVSMFKQIQENHENIVGISEFNGIDGIGHAATDGDWLESMIQSGKITIDRAAIDKKGHLSFSSTGVSSDTRLEYTTTSTIDKKELAKAEAEYEHEMKKINAKDKRYDMDLSKLEAERTALKTEYDSVKKVISDNIERTFGIFS